MTDRPDPTPKERLRRETASALLARASELDAAASDGMTVTELRAAAAEAGISSAAFETALGELRGAGRGQQSETSPRRWRSKRIGAVAVGLALLAAGALFTVLQTHAVRVRSTVNSAPVLPAAAELPAPVLPPARAADQNPEQVVVRSAGGGAAVTMGVQREGWLFASLGVAPNADGRRIGHIQLTDFGAGTATTPAALEVSSEPGVVVFSVPTSSRELELIVPGAAVETRGHIIRLVRDHAGGPLRAEVVSPAAR